MNHVVFRLGFWLFGNFNQHASLKRYLIKSSLNYQNRNKRSEIVRSATSSSRFLSDLGNYKTPLGRKRKGASDKNIYDKETYANVHLVAYFNVSFILPSLAMYQRKVSLWDPLSFSPYLQSVTLCGHITGTLSPRSKANKSCVKQIQTEVVRNSNRSHNFRGFSFLQFTQL